MADPEKRLQILQDELSLYQQAAVQTGFRLEVIAKTGEEYQTRQNSGRRIVEESVRVMHGRVGISLTRPENIDREEGFYPFNKALERLKFPS